MNVAYGAGHPAVFKRRTGVLAVVFEVELYACTILHKRICFHNRRVTLTQIDNGVEGHDRSDKFVIHVDPFKRRDRQHFTIIENLLPCFF